MRVREESLAYIEAVESEVEAIFRSRGTLALPGAGAAALPAQAFVCGIRREDEFRVFAALHLKSIKRNLVYSVVQAKAGKSGYEAALKSALEACRTMGFAMESLNLKFSTAMREVVIRDIPVLLSPAAAQKAAAQRARELAELERLTLQPEESEAPEEAGAGLSPARCTARERTRLERQEEAKAAARKLAAEGAADETVIATRRAVERLLASGFEGVRSTADIAPAPGLRGKADPRQLPPGADGDAPLATFVAARPMALPEGADTLEVQRLARELDRLMAEKAAAEQRAAELTEATRLAAARAEAERAERERLETAKAAAEQRAAELAEATRLAVQRVEAERADRAQLLAEKEAAEQRATELAEAARAAELQAIDFRAEQERLVAVQAERERAERERLVAEKAVAERRAMELAEAARSAEARVVTSWSATERQASEQVEWERAERQRLEAAKAAAEQRAAELAEAVRQAALQIEAERAGRERLLAEKAIAERQAAERAEAERRERERLEVEKVRIERRLQEQAEDADRAGFGAAERDRPPTMLPSLGGRFERERRSTDTSAAQLPKSSSRPAVPGAFFQVDWELADIVYDSGDDVLEVRQSINMTQLSLEGFPNQYCTAYIVAVKKGRGRQVYVAFRLASSNRVLVYVPTAPPHNQDAYARTMQAASKFLRVTGIETENLPLGKSSQSRAQALSQIPVLRRHPRNAGNP